MRTHFIGIGGIGMSALARILLQRNRPVSGSDERSSAITESLQKEGAKIAIGHSAAAIVGDERVIYSTDIAHDNVEFQEAKRKGCTLMHRSDLLKELMDIHSPLLISGTHGKTTTSSLLAHVLIQARLDPAFAIGGIVKSLLTNGRHGKGDYFVAEADESDGSFLKYHGYGAIITNIDNDHLNYWKTTEALVKGFKTFAQQVISQDHLLWCCDDETLSNLKLPGISYGFSEKADALIENFRQMGWKTFFDLKLDGKTYSEIELSLIGAHNVLNASAVFALARRLGVSEEDIRSALSTFQGVGRRADKKGEINSISVYDDYGHHPTEIFATLRALKQASGHKRLVVVFQPHRYTRTRDCLHEFSEAFESADVLVLTDIYSAGEPTIEGITSDAVVKKISEKRNVHYVPRQALLSYLVKFLQPNDILVTMGAGDVTKVGPEVLEKLQEPAAKPSACEKSKILTNPCQNPQAGSAGGDGGILENVDEPPTGQGASKGRFCAAEGFTTGSNDETVPSP